MYKTVLTSAVGSGVTPACARRIVPFTSKHPHHVYVCHRDESATNSPIHCRSACLRQRCRKVLLAAPAGPQGAGAVFKSAGENCRRADFLVAVSPTPMLKGTRSSNDNTASVRPGPDLDPGSARASKTSRTGWRYSSSVTPGSLRLFRASARSNDPVLSDTHEAGTETESNQEGEDDNFRRRLVTFAGGAKRAGPGPGAALWLPASTKTSAAVGRGTAAASPTQHPNKVKVRRLVRHLEAGLKLKGRPGAGGLPVGSQKIDMPYTKELAKWNYDEILGIPRTAGPT